MGALYFGEDYVTMIKTRAKDFPAKCSNKPAVPKRNKQSIIPKKPKQEPLTRIIPGNHPVIFTDGNNKKKKIVVRK